MNTGNLSIGSAISIARRLLGEVKPEVYLISENKKTGETFDPPYLKLGFETGLEFPPTGYPGCTWSNVSSGK